MHDYFTGHDTSAITVAGKDGPSTDIDHFGTIVAIDDLVTEGPDRSTKKIGRAQDSRSETKKEKAMSNLLSFVSNSFIPLVAVSLLYWAYTFPNGQPKQTNLVCYMHDYYTGHDTSAMTVAGKNGPSTSIVDFGTLAAIDDAVTEGPDRSSKEIGRAQGMYINSQLDGRALHMMFSVIFTDGKYKGSTLEFQGFDPFIAEEREFSIVSGTGGFRFVKGYVIMTTESMDIPRKLSHGNTKNLQKVKEVLKTSGVPSIATSPHDSLQNGNWVKLICGASFEDVVDVRNLSLVYTLAGVDCIDCAADASVVSAVNEGIEAAREILHFRRPWVMISVNDDEDLHFRKAEFDPRDCPLDCSRPCENVCPADAILLDGTPGALKRGVITERCYGCGRCFPVCPYDKIRAITYVRDTVATAELLRRDDVDAVEIHTNGRQTVLFDKLWNGLGDSVTTLRLVAVSLPNNGDSTISSMNTMYSIMEANLRCLNLWQLDGRPMSGDIGRGATRESIAFAVQLTGAEDKPRGFLQLAGGTNAQTVDGLRKVGLFKTTNMTENSKGRSLPLTSPNLSHALIGGVAYGGYARKIVGRVLSSVQSDHGHAHVEDHPEHLLNAVVQALALVGGVKCYSKAMSNLLNFASNSFIPLLALPLLYWAYAFHKRQPKQTNLVFYVHDYLSGQDASAITVAGKEGPSTSILQFGTLLAVDDPVTVGPDPSSKQIGRAQGMYINSQLDGKGLHLVFSVIFTDGEYKGSTLEIQGADIFAMKEREFSVVSGTGYFRFVKGYGIMTTEFMDIPNLRAILKLNVTVKHY
ncbi:hypothetical protein RJ640_014688 [Escallonia rubra]|uniref:4Fe-4S ferredoxin-type domain-containing protein n=1 Tax=Escallonia rubra TaxID=112253 RepID=A0AA88S1G6_9ASTE|nr:hypothetical protein RJ640_014688 [Escallonia rubra]